MSDEVEVKTEEQPKKKRGRPRKVKPEEKVEVKETYVTVTPVEKDNTDESDKAAPWEKE